MGFDQSKHVQGPIYIYVTIIHVYIYNQVSFLSLALALILFSITVLIVLVRRRDTVDWITFIIFLLNWLSWKSLFCKLLSSCLCSELNMNISLLISVICLTIYVTIDAY